MSKEKMTANMVSFACPDTIRNEIADYRYGSRIPSEGEAIRRLLADSLARLKESAPQPA